MQMAVMAREREGGGLNVKKKIAKSEGTSLKALAKQLGGVGGLSRSS
jgi:hypothetical protein